MKTILPLDAAIRAAKHARHTRALHVRDILLPNVFSSTPYPVDKRCSRCGPKRVQWHCRDCGRFTCEHLCSFKDADGFATCSKCLLRGAR